MSTILLPLTGSLHLVDPCYFSVDRVDHFLDSHVLHRRITHRTRARWRIVDRILGGPDKSYGSHRWLGLFAIGGGLAHWALASPVGLGTLPALAGRTGRFMDITKPEGSTMILDFNYAYNPYCAYTDGYSCPITPQENYIDIEVNAGIKGPDGH